MFYYIHNVLLYTQCFIIYTMFYYIHNVLLYKHCFIIYTMFYYIHNVLLYTQCFIIYTMLYYIHNVLLYTQCFIIYFSDNFNIFLFCLCFYLRSFTRLFFQIYIFLTILNFKNSFANL